MSNYVDPEATRPIERPCTCPGTPHTMDTADIRVRFGWGERQAILEAGGPLATNLAGFTAGIKRWNLVLPDGKPRPLDRLNFILLDNDTSDWLIGELDEAMKDEPLPNPSSGPSPSGSQETATPTPTPPISIETSPASTTT